MEIDVSPDQIWYYKLGTPIEECRSRLARENLGPGEERPLRDGTYDGMYVEAFGERWLATVTFRDGKLFRQTLLLTLSDRKALKRIYQNVKEEFGMGVRHGLFKPSAYSWDYKTSQLILTIKDAGPLQGILLILTAKNSG